MEKPINLIHKSSTESTNDDVMKLGLEGAPDFTTVVADYQIRGRGRRGNEWHAPPQTCLLFSILLRPNTDSALWTRIPQIAGMELIHTVESHFEHAPDIKLKWPNDLYYYDMKWSGILVEAKLGAEPFLVLGIGINCFDFGPNVPKELKSSCTSLEQIFAQNAYNPHDLLKSFICRIRGSLDQFLFDFAPVVAFANRRDYLAGRRLSVTEDGEKIYGVGSGIAPHGELQLDIGGGRRHLVSSGTISLE